MKNRFLTLALWLGLLAGFGAPTRAAEPDWQVHFGGGGDEFTAVTAVPDGIVAVGFSSQESFGKGDWEGVASKDTVPYYSDAIAVKYDSSGNVLWKRSIGGAGDDRFLSVAAVPGGVVAVGWSSALGTGDWAGIPRKTDVGHASEPIMVKFDLTGNIVWKKTFGTSGGGEFAGVAAMDDGFVAVGHAYSIGTGDWAGLESIAGVGDATIVKFDFDGNAVWKKIFGGYAYNEFQAVTVTPDGIVAVGLAYAGAFGTGDWEGVRAKTIDDTDAIVVVFRSDGTVAWKHNYGGSARNEFHGVTPIPDGFIAVGIKEWFGPYGIGHGMVQAAMAEYSFYTGFAGETMLGADTAEGTNINRFTAVTTMPDGYAVAGYATAYGSYNNVALAVKFDMNAQAVWNQYYSVTREPYEWEDEDLLKVLDGDAEYYGMAAVPGGVVAVGAIKRDYVGRYGFITQYPDNGDAIIETPSAWAKAHVGWAISQGLVPQSLQSKYTQPATRAEFCALAVALYESRLGEIPGRSAFTDTDDVNVQKAAAIGVVTGVGDGRFSPDTQLTREQAATMLARLASAMGAPLASGTATFADNASISPWAMESVGRLQAAGIMDGIGNNAFAPQDPYTREQSIVTMLRLVDAASE